MNLRPVNPRLMDLWLANLRSTDAMSGDPRSVDSKSADDFGGLEVGESEASEP